ncbi:MAG: serpin family protein [Sedimentisphaerales bacterium]|nr:serpin family protein [Sedimentisphaerales bacterium]
MRANKCAFTVVVVVVTAVGCFGGEQRKADPELDKVVVQGNNEFALALFARLRENQGNLFFSPYSISTALAMTYAGARGQTETQMAKVLHFPTLAGEKVPPEPVMQEGQFHSAFGVVVKDLNQRAKKGNYELAVANALWGQKGYKLLNDFLRLIETEYGGRLTEVDFVTATESARKTINAWVEEKTRDKIKELLKPGVLDAMTRLVLTNAIYFKGNWARQFKKDRTKQSPFTLASGEKVDAPMMNQTGEFRYMEAEDFQALELPYVDNELSMIILLPKETDALPKFEKTLNLEDFSQWLDRLHRREVIVSVPKFKMTSHFSLASVLTSMGMADAFSATAADFSGITGGRDLFISAVIHKAYVDVNEEGTEAAAATGVTMRLTSVGPTQTPVFRADHPFLFLIRDNHSGGILFIGRLMNPQV